MLARNSGNRKPHQILDADAMISAADPINVVHICNICSDRERPLNNTLHLIVRMRLWAPSILIETSSSIHSFYVVINQSNQSNQGLTYITAYPMTLFVLSSLQEANWRQKFQKLQMVHPAENSSFLVYPHLICRCAIWDLISTKFSKISLVPASLCM